MLTLPTVRACAEPFWLEIGAGVSLELRPVTLEMMLAAREAARAVYQAGDADAALLASRSYAAYVRSLLRTGLVSWKGVIDTDGDEVDPSPEAINALCDIRPAYDAVDTLYVTPGVAANEGAWIAATSRAH